MNKESEGQRVLIVDPDAHSRALMRAALRSSDVHTLTATNPVDALQLLLSHPVDLILTESHFPEREALAFARQVKSDPHTCEIPLVFVARPADVGEKIEGLELGAEDYLEKPIYLREFVNRVKGYLKKYAQERALESGGQSRYRGVLSGTLLHDILEGLRQQQRSGSILLRRERHQGRLSFRDGNLISARLNDRQGAEAALELLLWENGEFEVRFEDPAPGGAIQGNAQTLPGHALAARAAYRRLFASTEFVEQLPLAQAMELAKERDDEQLLAYLKGLFSGSADRRNEAPPQEIVTRLSKLYREAAEASTEKAASETPPVQAESTPQAPSAQQREAANESIASNPGTPAAVQRTEESFSGFRRFWPWLLLVGLLLLALSIGFFGGWKRDACIRALGGLRTAGENVRSDVAIKGSNAQEARQVAPSPAKDRKEQAALVQTPESDVTEEAQKKAPENTEHPEISMNTASTGSAASSKSARSSVAEKQSKKIATGTQVYWLQNGESRLRARDLDKAEAAFRRAGQINPNSASAQIGLGRVELERGHSQQAISYFQQALALDPKSSQGWLLLGTACQILGQRQAARQAYERYLALVGDSKKAKEVKQLLEGL